MIRRRYVYSERTFPKAKMSHGHIVRKRKGMFHKKTGEFIPYGGSDYIGYSKKHFYSKRKSIDRRSWGYG